MQQHKLIILNLEILTGDRETEIQKAMERDTSNGSRIFGMGNWVTGIQPKSILEKFPHLFALYLSQSNGETCGEYRQGRSPVLLDREQLTLGDIQSFRNLKSPEAKEPYSLDSFLLPNTGIIQYIHLGHYCDVPRSCITVVGTEEDRLVASNYYCQFVQFFDWLCCNVNAEAIHTYSNSS